MEWADVYPELTGRPTELRAAFDAALDRLANPGPFTVQDGLDHVMLAGKFRAEVWPMLDAAECRAYLDRVAGVRARRHGGR